MLQNLVRAFGFFFLCFLTSDSLLAQNGIVRKAQFGYSTENHFEKVFDAGNNNYIVLAIGNYPSTHHIIKYDQQFNQVWKIPIEGFISSMAITADSGYILCGDQAGPGIDEVWSTQLRVIRLDKNGTVLWQKMYGGDGNQRGGCKWQNRDHQVCPNFKSTGIRNNS